MIEQIDFLYTLPHSGHKILNKELKTLFILHPHWLEGQANYRKFIKSIKPGLLKLPGYLIEATGKYTYKGYVILERIKKHIERTNLCSSVRLRTNQSTNIYTLTVKVKDK